MNLAARWYRDCRSPLPHQQHSLDSMYLVAERRSNRHMSRQQLVVPPGQGVPRASQLLVDPFASRGSVAALPLDVVIGPCRRAF